MPRSCCRPQPDQVVLPETAVDYTLYGDSVYAIREEGSDADGKPVLKAYRIAGEDRHPLGRQGGDPVRRQTGRQVVAAGQVKLQNGAAVTVTGNPPPQPPANPTPN